MIEQRKEVKNAERILYLFLQGVIIIFEISCIIERICLIVIFIFSIRIIS